MPGNERHNAAMRNGTRCKRHVMRLILFSSNNKQVELQYSE